MLRVERLVHKVALRVSEKTKKSAETQDSVEVTAKGGSPAATANRVTDVPQQDYDISKYPHSPDHILGYSSEAQKQKNHNNVDQSPPVELPSREQTPSISEPVQSPTHKRSSSDSRVQQASVDELWIQHQNATSRTQTFSYSTPQYPEALTSGLRPSRTPSPKYLTPQYAPIPYQRQHASSFSAYSPPRPSTSSETLETRPGRPEDQASQPSNRLRTHSAPAPAPIPATTRSDTMQIIKSRRLSQHPLTLLPGPSFSAYRPPTPPESSLQKQPEPPSAPVTASQPQTWPLAEESSRKSMETYVQPRSDAADDVSTVGSSIRSTWTRTDTQSPEITLDTPSTIIETPLEQGLATALTFQRSFEVEPKILAKKSERDRKTKDVRNEKGPRRDETLNSSGDISIQRQFSFQESPVWAYKPFFNKGDEGLLPKKAETVSDITVGAPTKNDSAYQQTVKPEDDERTGRSDTRSSRRAHDDVRSRSMSRPRPSVYQRASLDKDREQGRAQSLGPKNRAASETDDRRRSIIPPVPQPQQTEKTKQNESRERNDRPRPTSADNRSQSANRPRSQSRARSSTALPTSVALPLEGKSSYKNEDNERSGRSALTAADRAARDDRSRSASRPRSQSRARSSSRPRYYAQLNEERTKRVSEDKETAREEWKAVGEIGLALSKPVS
ncbi:MAG: hypothetical protein M1821_007761 [Bathelium mastoideum]|nr:MAG: hypothetical protein M1821_007761 [Bathelium mastoideum]